MSSLPVVLEAEGTYTVLDREHGEMIALSEASVHAIAQAAEELAAHDKAVFLLKRALAHELRVRFGVGTWSAGGYAGSVNESRSWPVGATKATLDALVADGKITAADRERCMPSNPKPSATQLKALVGRLTTDDPVSAALLASACTKSPPSLSDVRAVAVDATP